MPDFWNAVLMSLPSRLWSRLVCCASTCAIASRNFGGRLLDDTAAPRLANSGARLSCSVAAACAATDTAARSTGVNASFGATMVGRLATASASASGESVTASAAAPAASPPCPTTARRMPSLVCVTASCRVWPCCSGISEATSIERLAIAIRTRSAERIFRTCALTTLPGCSTSSGAMPPASWAASTGATVLIEIAIS